MLMLLLGILCFACTTQASAATVTAVSAAKTVKGGKWVKVGSKSRYRYKNGKYAKNVWLKIGGSIYRIGADGYLQKGFITFNGKTYYAKKTNGKILQKKWLTYKNNRYFFSSYGICVKNRWLRINKKYYYFQKNGVMARNQMITTSGKTYYVNKSGVRIKSMWLVKGGKKYYFNKYGVRLENRWLKSGGKYYYLGAGGVMAVNQWVGDYYVGSNGARKTKCYVDGYYLDATGKKTVKLFKGDYIYVGDSRMVGMEISSPSSDSLYIAQVGADYTWLSTTGGETLKQHLNLNPKVKVVLAFGVNDLGNISSYITYYRKLISSYPKTTFYVSAVGPVDEKVEKEHGFSIKNSDICVFNNKLYKAFRSPTFVNIYRGLTESGFVAWDGVHYTVNTYKSLHQFILSRIG